MMALHPLFTKERNCLYTLSNSGWNCVIWKPLMTFKILYLVILQRQNKNFTSQRHEQKKIFYYSILMRLIMNLTRPQNISQPKFICGDNHLKEVYKLKFPCIIVCLDKQNTGTIHTSKLNSVHDCQDFFLFLKTRYRWRSLLQEKSKQRLCQLFNLQAFECVPALHI